MNRHDRLTEYTRHSSVSEVVASDILKGAIENELFIPYKDVWISPHTLSLLEGRILSIMTKDKIKCRPNTNFVNVVVFERGLYKLKSGIIFRCAYPECINDCDYCATLYDLIKHVKT